MNRQIMKIQIKFPTFRNTTKFYRHLLTSGGGFPDPPPPPPPVFGYATANKSECIFIILTTKSTNLYRFAIYSV